MKYAKLWLLSGLFATVNSYFFAAMIESTGHLARALPSAGLAMPGYGRVPAYRTYQPQRVYGTEAQKSQSALMTGLNNNDHKKKQNQNPIGETARRQLYGLAGLATGAAGTYGSMTLYQRIKEEKAKKHEEALLAEETQQKELKNVFFDELENSDKYGSAFNFIEVPAAYRAYVLKQYKNRIVQEGIELAKYIPETNFSDVLLLAKDSLKKRYELWKSLLERQFVYTMLISPEQLAEKLAQIEREWFNSNLSIEAFLDAKKETKEEQKMLVKKYKNIYKPSWFSPKFTEVEKVLPESTLNLIQNYEDYVDGWKTEGEKKLKLLRIEKYFKPKARIIQRPVAEPLMGESPYKEELGLTSE